MAGLRFRMGLSWYKSQRHKILMLLFVCGMITALTLIEDVMRKRHTGRKTLSVKLKSNATSNVHPDSLIFHGEPGKSKPPPAAKPEASTIGTSTISGNISYDYPKPPQELIAEHTKHHKSSPVSEEEDSESESDDFLEDDDGKDNPTSVCSHDVRYKHLRYVCKKRRWIDENFRTVDHVDKLHLRKSNIYVDHKHKLMYCTISKAAHSTIRNYFVRIHAESEYNATWGTALGRDDFLNQTGIVLLKDVPSKRIKQLVRNYFKFIVVRHPWERLRSCWVENIAHHGDILASPQLLSIIQKYLDFVEPHINHRYTKSITFRDFVFLVSTKYHQGFFNGHWVSYDEQCGVCDFPYDHIIRTETIEEDSQVLLEHLRAVTENNLLPPLLPVRSDPGRLSGDREMRKLKDLFSGFPAGLMSGLMNIYGKDMDVFGYHWDPVQGATCSMHKVDKTRCC